MRSIVRYRSLRCIPCVSAVAYVKYDKASSAAAAIEALHETSLCDGRGPMLKVMVAEAPTRCAACNPLYSLEYRPNNVRC